MRGIKKFVLGILLDSRTMLFFVGFLLAGSLIFHFLADYEKRVFASLAGQVRKSAASSNDDSLFKTAVHTTFELLEVRSRVFGQEETGGVIDNIIHPVAADMTTAEGSCGSYSIVLARVLYSLGYESRFAQMKTSNGTVGHIVLEARSQHGWVVLDPRYDLYFSRPNGQLASFDEVSANWQAYKNSVPANYDQRYNYAGVRYTNWQKIPVLMPALHHTLSLFMSKDTLDHFSLRPYFLRKYVVCRNLLLLAAGLLCTILLPRMFRTRLYKSSPFLYSLDQPFPQTNPVRA